MCGRFALFTPAHRVAEVFDVLAPDDLVPRYNIAPSQDVLAVFADDGHRRAAPMRWGLVPSWARDPKIAYKLTNARSETARSKPSFRSAFTRRRCLVPADGFYEWVRDGKQKLPWFIRVRGDAPFALAGLWERWTSPTGEVITSCTLLTTGPNALMAPIHHRMPCILPPSHWRAWLDPDLRDADAVEAMLGPYPADEMEARRVSTRVNNARNEGATLLEAPAD